MYNHPLFDLLECDIGSFDIILGLPWLERHNPTISWSQHVVVFDGCVGNCSSPSSSPPRIVGTATSSSSGAHRTGVPKIASVRPTTTSDQGATMPSPLAISLVSPDEFRDLLDDAAVSGAVRLLPLASVAAVSQTSSTSGSDAPPSLDLTPEQLAAIPPSLQDLAPVFSKQSADSLPPHRSFDIKIELKDGAVPPFGPLYTLSLAEIETLHKWIEDSLAKGHIRPSESPAASPILFVKKKDGSMRLCVDYRALNNITVKNRAPLPRIDQLIDLTRGSTVFSKIDLRSAYNLLRVAEGDEWKTAFRTPFGLFETLVMPFGLTNAPPVFQTFISSVLARHIGPHGYVVVYLDDILVYSRDQDSHTQHLRAVLSDLLNARLFAKLEKCDFFREEVEFLGYRIGVGSLKMDPAKVSTVADWPTPSSVRQVQQFLGFCNFYRRFIPRYAEHARSLSRLTHKDERFDISPNSPAFASFLALKNAFVTGPVLRSFDPTRQITMITDASQYALSAQLYQDDEQGFLQPVAFHSRQFTPPEINYQTYDQEMLAIAAGFDAFRHWCHGSPLPVVVKSDHNNLSYFRTCRQLNARQARWYCDLVEFDFVIQHLPGKKNPADAPSRRPDFLPDPNDLNPHSHREFQFLRDSSDSASASAAVVLKISALSFDLPPNDLLQDLRAAWPHDEELQDALAEQDPDFTTGENNLTLYRDRIFVPSSLRRRVVSDAHDIPAAGHRGYATTFHLPLEVPTRPWNVIGLDHIVDLPLSSGHNAILVVVDHLTSQVHLVPANTTDDAADLARQFIQNVFRLHGFPSRIVSDRGTTFVSAFWRRVCQLLRIKNSPSTAFHPQTNGLVERVNQTLEAYLRSYISYRQDDWCDLLPLAEFSFNNSLSASRDTTPFYANLGFHPRHTLSVVDSTIVPAAESHIDALRREQDELKAQLAFAKDKMREYYDRFRAPTPSSFKVGALVWLLRKNIATTRPSDKLDHRRLGPFKITALVGSSAFRLALPSSMDTVHPVFHASLLEPYHPSHQPIESPAPELASDAFAGATILDSRVRYNRVEYFIRLHNRPVSENAWYAYSNLPASIRPLLRRFHSTNPRFRVPRHLGDPSRWRQSSPSRSPSPQDPTLADDTTASTSASRSAARGPHRQHRDVDFLRSVALQPRTTASGRTTRPSAPKGGG
ncbi:hypothetical protein JCM8115_002497 [Rhodotorula mucilaginosa]